MDPTMISSTLITKVDTRPPLLITSINQVENEANDNWNS